jgi:hypothetical protein
LLMLIGGILTIILIGGIITFIAWIIAAQGFFSMKAPTTQTYPSTSQTPTLNTTQKKTCPNCGTENNADSLYCTHCGGKL